MQGDEANRLKKKSINEHISSRKFNAKKFVTEDLKTVIYRGCHYQEDGLSRDCRHKKYNTGIDTEYCMTCSTDGCNDALDYDLLKKSLLANGAADGMTHSMNIFLIIILIFHWFF